MKLIIYFEELFKQSFVDRQNGGSFSFDRFTKSDSVQLSSSSSSASSFVLSLLDLSAKNIAYAILSLSDDEQRKKAIEIVEAIPGELERARRELDEEKEKRKSETTKKCSKCDKECISFFTLIMKFLGISS